MTSVTRPHDGPTSGNVDGPWRHPAPTWREEGSNAIYSKSNSRRQVEASGVIAKGAPLWLPQLA